jgi:hypothetical protein
MPWPPDNKSLNKLKGEVAWNGLMQIKPLAIFRYSLI